MTPRQFSYTNKKAFYNTLPPRTQLDIMQFTLSSVLAILAVSTVTAMPADSSEANAPLAKRDWTGVSTCCTNGKI